MDAVAENDFFERQSGFGGQFGGALVQAAHQFEVEGRLAAGVFEFDALEAVLLRRVEDGLDGLQAGGLAHAGGGFADIAVGAVEVAGVGDVQPDGEGFGLGGLGDGGCSGRLDELLAGQFGVNLLAEGFGDGKFLPAPPGGRVENAGTARGVGAEGEVEAVGEGGGVGAGLGVEGKGGGGGNGREAERPVWAGAVVVYFLAASWGKNQQKCFIGAGAVIVALILLAGKQDRCLRVHRVPLETAVAAG